jgi:hypothetical protein
MIGAGPVLSFLSRAKWKLRCLIANPERRGYVEENGRGGPRAPYGRRTPVARPRPADGPIPRSRFKDILRPRADSGRTWESNSDSSPIFERYPYAGGFESGWAGW